MANVADTNSRAARRLSRRSRDGVSGRYERGHPGRDTVIPTGSLADGVGSLSRDEDIPSGDIACDECDADPSQYLTDFGVTCPTCRGTGHFADPDYYDGEGLDARSEFGTMPRLRGNGRGQL